jgi:beta-ketodecanoyl-[acyl-carrier-protein] synthase
MLHEVLLTASACYAPDEIISNDELVASFNLYVKTFNKQHEQEIAAGKREALRESSDAFIVKASGIKNRHVIDKQGILDINLMQPQIKKRADTELSLQAELCVKAAKIALHRANKSAADVDFVLVACSAYERSYPAISIEVQAALGCSGYAYDMNVACSSATFAIQAAADAIKTGSSKIALVINPEITSAHLNFKDRDSHFIFGDACTAVVLETRATCESNQAFEIISSQLKTQFSNNIRNNFGILNNSYTDTHEASDLLFKQNGRQVFKEISPMAAKFILDHLHKNNLRPEAIKRFWMHQANSNMNHLIMEKILGANASADNAPMILDEYANTASAGSLICFDHHHSDFKSGEYGLLSSFGAGYSIGSIILRKI